MTDIKPTRCISPVIKFCQECKWGWVKYPTWVETAEDLEWCTFESGNFWVDGKRADDWYKPYCQIAEHLSQQGYIVFTSSHEVVRKQLENSNETVILVFPSVELKDKWIEKLETRYQESGSEKDYKALMNAKDRYTENIQELEASNIGHKMILKDIEYDLEAALIHLRNRDIKV